MICLTVFGSVALLCGHNGALALGVCVVLAGLGGVAVRDIFDAIRRRND